MENMDKQKEKELLLKRFLTPRQICKLALDRGITGECEREISEEYILSLLPKLEETMEENELVEAIEELGERHLHEIIFRGKYYEVLGGTVRCKSAVQKLKEDVKAAIRKHKWKSFYTLQCAVELEEFHYNSIVRCLAEKNVDYMPGPMLLLLTNKYRLLLKMKERGQKTWKIPEEAKEYISAVLDTVEDRITWHKRIRKGE